MILNEQEFKAFIKPLQEVNDYLHKAKVSWMNHSEDIINKALEDWDVTQQQENTYLILCEKMGLSIVELLQVIESTKNDADNLKNKLQSNK